MKTTKIFEAINIARMNAPTWELYTFDGDELGEQVNFDLVPGEDEGLKDYFGSLPLNGCYLFAWFSTDENAKEFGEWIKNTIKDDENAVFYANFTLVDTSAMYRGDEFFLQIMQLDHEV